MWNSNFIVEDCDSSSIQTEIHNYTGRCPTLTYEINPVRGCGVECRYCLVSDGIHKRVIKAIGNYHLYVRRLLEQMNGEGSENRNHYYYFSPKTEAFQAATLQTGIAHRILREFIDHFKRFPASKARLFIASKAGAGDLMAADEKGETILDLFVRLKGRMQFNTSVSIMPAEIRRETEPYASSIEERLEAVKLCHKYGIMANSALVQPIFTPCLSDETIRTFFNSLHEAGIVNYKPEFLTVCKENLAVLGEILGRYDKDMEKRLYEDYMSPSNADHVKQRSRTAPDRALCMENIRRMMAYTDTLGMSVSICYWVRRQLEIGEDMIPVINSNGFQCLGYQSMLFEK